MICTFIITIVPIESEKIEPLFINRSREFVTFYATPNKPSNDLYIKLMVSIASWLLSSPDSQVVLLVNLSEFDLDRSFYHNMSKNFGENRLHYVKFTSGNREGKPFLTDIFHIIFEQNISNIATFINTDIILMEKYQELLTKMTDIFGVTGSYICRRMNFYMENNEFYQINLTSKESYYEDMNRNIEKGKPFDYGHRGIDFFTFRTDYNIIDVNLMPKFVISHYGYDNWIAGYLDQKSSLVSYGEEHKVFHVEHITTPKSHRSSMATFNKRLRWFAFSYDGDNKKSNWIVVNNTIVSKTKKNVFL